MDYLPVVAAEEGFGNPLAQKPNSGDVKKGHAGDGDATRKDRVIFANDRVGKVDDQGGFLFGNVAINKVSGETRIEWDDGKMELLKEEGHGVLLQNKIGIFDRRCVGVGSRVTDGAREGVVRDKRFLITVAMENDWGNVIRDIPSDELVRLGYSRKDDKVIYKDEWIGLVVNTRAGIQFQMDKDGRTGYITDDKYTLFPNAGDKITNMMLTHFWDVKWSTEGEGEGSTSSKVGWFWNFVKYLGNSATVLESRIDTLAMAWMGHIEHGLVPQGNQASSSSLTPPPNSLRASEDVQEVRFLYGRNWRYLKDYDVWGYKLKEGEKVVTYGDYVRDMWDAVFFGPEDESIEVSDSKGKEKDPPADREEMLKVRVAGWRSIVDVEWEGCDTTESYEAHLIEPLKPDGNPWAPFICTDIVKDPRENATSSKYGIILKIRKGSALIKWIHPSGEDEPKITEVWEDFQLKRPFLLHPNYLFLKALVHLPIVVPKRQDETGRKLARDGVRVGIATGLDLATGKMYVKTADEKESLVWIHDFEHFEGDVIMDGETCRWKSWYQVLIGESGERRVDCFKEIVDTDMNSRAQDIGSVSIALGDEVLFKM